MITSPRTAAPFDQGIVENQLILWSENTMCRSIGAAATATRGVVIDHAAMMTGVCTCLILLEEVIASEKLLLLLLLGT